MVSLKSVMNELTALPLRFDADFDDYVEAVAGTNSKDKHEDNNLNERAILQEWYRSRATGRERPFDVTLISRRCKRFLFLVSSTWVILCLLLSCLLEFSEFLESAAPHNLLLHLPPKPVREVFSLSISDFWQVQISREAPLISSNLDETFFSSCS